MPGIGVSLSRLRTLRDLFESGSKLHRKNGKNALATQSAA